MTSLLDVISTVVVVVVIFLTIKLVALMRARWNYQAVLNDFIEHPRGIYFLGHGKALKEGARGIAGSFDEIYENNVKAMQVWITPFEPVICVYHPDTMKGILTRSGPKLWPEIIQPWIGDGLLVSTGKKWARNRRLLTPGFHFEILKPYVNEFVECAQHLADKWRNHSDVEECSIEITQDLSLATLESLLKCVMGVEEESVKLAELDNHPYVNAIYTLTEQITLRVLNTFYMSDLIYELSPDGFTNRQALKMAHRFTRKVVQERKEKLRLASGEAPNRERLMPFIDILLQAKDADGVGLSNQEIYDEMDTFMFEGHDTTASGLSWIVYNLAQHPELQERCREEVDEVMDGIESNDLKWEDLSKLEYVTQFIKESMRIDPVVPSIGRKMTSSLTLPDGRIIPNGMNVFMDIKGLHHNPNVWKNPMVFDPERFSKENSIARSSHDFVPFSAGPRNCIGQHFAMSEMKTFIAVLLRHFRFAPENSKPVKRTVNAVLRSTTGIHVFVTPRTN